MSFGTIHVKATQRELLTYLPVYYPRRFITLYMQFQNTIVLSDLGHLEQWLSGSTQCDKYSTVDPGPEVAGPPKKEKSQR
jgi:hypothetical protein